MKQSQVAIAILSFNLIFFAASPSFAGAKDLVEEVEVKAVLDVSSSSQSLVAAFRKLGLKKSSAERRQIIFIDTARKDLYRDGTLVRLRVDEDGEGDVTVKSRPASGKVLWNEYSEDEGFKCEDDMGLKKRVTSCSLKQDIDEGKVADFLSGDKTAKSILNKDQETLLEELGFDQNWSDLVVVAKAKSLSWDLEIDALDEELSVEAWELSSGKVFLEVSVKVKVGEESVAKNQLLSFLKEKALPIKTEGRTKTEELFVP